ncbi:hypothetical protein Q4Q35_10570 [Flavivirga aquimarina]|uniref:DUF4468 domain-containing protein n=1 Tax=Flavivirga aquimarina TaxID=2027862 RepID=A0ABT8WAR9_9FLAO|nr:hypothetical protein [Flavivirga aquimarina]MDO5970249.1 hypothetical protein [Flavivirga aquimarina]
MKKIILFSIILMSAASFAQSDKNDDSQETKFVYNREGLSPKNITTYIDGKKKENMASKAEKWLDEKYGNFEDVLSKSDKSDEGETAKGNKKVTFTGLTNNAICFTEKSNYICGDIECKIELRFKDGEYRFRPINMFYKTSSSKKSKKINFQKNKFYSNDGKIIEGYEKVLSQVENLLNNLNKSLLNYLTDKEQEEEW